MTSASFLLSQTCFKNSIWVYMSCATIFPLIDWLIENHSSRLTLLLKTYIVFNRLQKGAVDSSQQRLDQVSLGIEIDYYLDYLRTLLKLSLSLYENHADDWKTPAWKHCCAQKRLPVSLCPSQQLKNLQVYETLLKRHYISWWSARKMILVAMACWMLICPIMHGNACNISKMVIYCLCLLHV